MTLLNIIRLALFELSEPAKLCCPDFEGSGGQEEEDLLDLIPDPLKGSAPDSVGVRLHINVAPAECEDHDRILPIISLGSVYLLTKPGAR